MENLKLKLKDWETFQEEIVSVYGEPSLMIPAKKEPYPNRHTFFFSDSRVVIIDSVLYSYDECTHLGIHNQHTELRIALPDSTFLSIDLCTYTEDEVNAIRNFVSKELVKQ